MLLVQELEFHRFKSNYFHTQKKKKKCFALSLSANLQLKNASFLLAFICSLYLQVLNRLTYASTLSHLRRLNSPIGREGKPKFV